MSECPGPKHLDWAERAKKAEEELEHYKNNPLSFMLEHIPTFSVEQLRALERNIGYAYQKYGSTYIEKFGFFPLSDEEKECCNNGRNGYIDAIKSYRNRCNVGLKTAKEAIDVYMGTEGKKIP